VTIKLTAFVASTWLACGIAAAQGVTWSEYVSRDDYFAISFPGEPTVEEIVYPTEYRIELPGRVYSYEQDGRRYAITVIDYRDAIDIHLARNEACRAAGGDGDQCQDDGPEEMRGAIVYASWNIMKRDGVTVEHYAHYNSDLVEGHAIRLTNADGSRTSAAIHMHEDRLYIIEATVPAGAPAPGLFQISMQFLDDEYKRVRYRWEGTRLYSNGYPPPARTR
jgi:hypothetical protein